LNAEILNNSILEKSRKVLFLPQRAQRFRKGRKVLPFHLAIMLSSYFFSWSAFRLTGTKQKWQFLIRIFQNKTF
jgi:hypothetical protein